MFMALGLFVFDQRTLLPSELQRRADWRFPSNPRVGARDGYQAVGPGEDRRTIGGTTIAELQDGEASLEDLRTMADSQQAFALLDATGKVHGSFVITGIDDSTHHWGGDMRPLAIDFSIELLKVEDPA